jgi:lipid A disaccharide synthetase
VALLPGSRHGEVARHIPTLLEAVGRIREHTDVQFVLALPAGFDLDSTTFSEPVRAASTDRDGGRTLRSRHRARAAARAIVSSRRGRRADPTGLH